MVDYNPKSWIKLIFAFHKSDTFRILWKEIIYIGIFSMLIAFFTITYFPKTVVLEKLIAIYSLIGFVLSLLLVFRTNTAYERWWEGRKKWGKLSMTRAIYPLNYLRFFPKKRIKRFLKTCFQILRSLQKNI